MSRTVEKIVINTEGIDVISVLNGVSNVTQISLESELNEIAGIFETYNLETGVIYRYDEKIVRALADNKEQLIDYLETCRRASYPAKKVDVPETIPDIEYDLRDLKNGFQDIEDNDLRRMKQMEFYRKAKEAQNMLKGKATLRMGILDRGYFSVQELLQNRNNKAIKALNPGSTESRTNLRKELYNPELTKATDEVSNQYAITQGEQQMSKGVQENKEVIAR